jgi:hypothetical protein
MLVDGEKAVDADVLVNVIGEFLLISRVSSSCKTALRSLSSLHFSETVLCLSS